MNAYCIQYLASGCDTCYCCDAKTKMKLNCRNCCRISAESDARKKKTLNAVVCFEMLSEM